MRAAPAAFHPDVLVIGGGPAGATAARLLASWGWAVTIVHRSSSRPSLAESLPASTRKLLAFVGLLDEVEAAGFQPNHGNVGRWAGTIRDTQTDAAGFHVPRAAFDTLLRRAAQHAGASIVDGAVRAVSLGREPQVRVAAGAGDRALQAPLLLDCSGRAGVVARGGFRRYAEYRTLAVAADWEADAWPAGDLSRTIVESYADGWAWSVPLSPARRQCTVMIEPRASRSSRRALPLQALYAGALDRTSELRARLKTARQTSRAWATDASVYSAPQPCAPGMLLVGDAASFIEPLSSAGVAKAITSGWRAAIVANTCLTRPSMTAHALDFHVRRERAVCADNQRRAQAFFREAALCHPAPFWAARTGADDDHAPAPADDGEIRRAHARLRASARAMLRPAASLQFDPSPEIEGREVVLRDGIRLPGSDAPLRFAAGVDLPALVRLARDGAAVPALCSAYHAHVGPAALDDLVTGLSLLVARQALILEDDRP